MHGVVYEGLYAYRSPSTRRAWIEISPGRRLAPGDQSPSTRRAWIEIVKNQDFFKKVKKVALHPEGVDRNNLRADVGVLLQSRPPPGGRG